MGFVFNLGALVVGIESVVDGGDFYAEELIVKPILLRVGFLFSGGGSVR